MTDIIKGGTRHAQALTPETGIGRIQGKARQGMAWQCTQGRPGISFAHLQLEGDVMLVHGSAVVSGVGYLGLQQPRLQEKQTKARTKEVKTKKLTNPSTNYCSQPTNQHQSTNQPTNHRVTQPTNLPTYKSQNTQFAKVKLTIVYQIG